MHEVTTQPAASSGVGPCGASRIDMEGAAYKAMSWTVLAQWIEAARGVLDSLNWSARNDPGVAEALKTWGVAHADPDWTDTESQALRRLMSDAEVHIKAMFEAASERAQAQATEASHA